MLNTDQILVYDVVGFVVFFLFFVVRFNVIVSKEDNERTSHSLIGRYYSFQNKKNYFGNNYIKTSLRKYACQSIKHFFLDITLLLRHSFEF